MGLSRFLEDTGKSRFLENTPTSSIGDKLKGLISSVGAGFQDIPAQAQDLFKIPSRLLNLPHPPMVSKLATETVPYLVEKAQTPIATFDVPIVSGRNASEALKLLIGQKPQFETTEVSPTPLDIAMAGAVVKGGIGNIGARVQTNRLLRRELAKPVIESEILQAQRRAGLKPWPAGQEPIETAATVEGVIPKPIQEVVTDTARVQEIKNSITEGENILRARTNFGKKLSAEELASIQRSVDNSKTKIGQFVTSPTGQVKLGLQPIAGGLPAKMPEQVSKWLEKGITITERQPAIRITEAEPKIKDISGNVVDLIPGHEMTPYKLSNGKIWLHDGKNVVVESGQLQNLKNKNLILGEKQFLTPEEQGVEEVVKGDKATQAFDDYNTFSQSLVDKYSKQHPGFNLNALVQEGVITKPELDKLDELDNVVRTYRSEKTKFSQYQLPGGENYKEMLFKAPTPKEGKFSELNKISNELLGIDYDKISGTEQQIAQQRIKVKHEYTKRFGETGFDAEQKSIFKSSHWDEPNVISHVRMNDRTTPDGKKILFIEEIQSDWARKGRQKGFRPTSTKSIEELQKRAAEIMAKGREATSSEKQEWADAMSIIEQKGVPSHPLLKNWQQFTLKKILKHAIDNGYDGISWTTGEQQAERYDLSKQVDEIKYAKNTQGTYEVSVYEKGKLQPSIVKKDQTPKDLEGLIGKDPTHKILNSQEEYGILRGQDLKIGGEWAKNLYDKQIPNILKDLTKSEIGTTEFEAPLVFKGQTPESGKGNFPGKQPFLKITPEVKARVMGDMPQAGGLPQEPQKPKQPKTLIQYIQQNGGLDPIKLSKDYNLGEWRQEGLTKTLRAKGRSLDDFVGELVEQNYIPNVPEDRTPADWLAEQLKYHGKDFLPDTKEYEKQIEEMSFGSQPRAKVYKEGIKTGKLQAKDEYKQALEGFKNKIRAQKNTPSFGKNWTAEQRKELYVQAMNKGLIYEDYNGKTNRVKFNALLKNHPETNFEQFTNLITNFKGTEPPKGRGGIVPPELNFGNWKDKQALSLSRETLERNIEDITGEEAPIVNKFITESIRDNETKRIEFVNMLRQDFADKLKTWKIKLNSLEDKLIQRYGEKRITLEELMKATPGWRQVIVASDYFREEYDKLLEMVNEQRKAFGYDPIPKREDYFRHFQEILNTINNFGVILRKNDLPTEISGITNIFKPGKPFTTAELKRKGGKFTESAIGGMDNYIETISKQIFHIDSVQRARVLEKYIRISGKEGLADLPNFVANLQEYGNLLSGKKAMFDRAFESVFGRPFYSIINGARQRTSANMIVGNVSSALTNFIPLTQALATTEKTAFIKGLVESLSAPFEKNINFIDGIKSDFLTRRYPKGAIVLDPTQKVVQSAMWLFRSIDMFVSKTIVAGKYYELLNKGISKELAMKQAGNYAGRVITDRSIGQLPNLMGAKSLGVFTQFQTEINNMYSFIKKDIPRMNEYNSGKVVSALIQFFIYSYLFNNLFEKAAGRRPAIDPIYAVLTLAGASQKGENKPLPQRAWVALMDLKDNLPFVGGLFGGRFPISAGIPDINKIMQGKNTLGKELTKPAAYLALPFGGGQLKKTMEGLSSYSKGYETTPSGRLKYAIEKNPANFFRGMLFGKSSFPESNRYFDKGITKKAKSSRFLN